MVFELSQQAVIKRGFESHMRPSLAIPTKALHFILILLQHAQIQGAGVLRVAQLRAKRKGFLLAEVFLFFGGRVGDFCLELHVDVFDI